MSIILNIPAIVRILIVFVLVLIAIRKNVSLGNAFLLGAILIGVLFGLTPGAMLLSAAGSIVMPKTLSLAVVVTLILVLSSSMELGGHMERLLNNFRGLVTNPRLNLAMFPALIGLLPMPGGAIFSAPMVKSWGIEAVSGRISSVSSTTGTVISGNTGGPSIREYSLL